MGNVFNRKLLRLAQLADLGIPLGLVLRIVSQALPEIIGACMGHVFSRKLNLIHQQPGHMRLTPIALKIVKAQPKWFGFAGKILGVG